MKTHYDDIKRTQWQVTETTRRIKEKSDNLLELLDHEDDMTIQSALNNFNMVMHTKQNELLTITKQMEGNQKDIQNIRKLYIEPLHIKKGQAVMIQNQYTENLVLQINLMNHYKIKYPHLLTTITTMITKDNYREVMIEQLLTNVQHESLQIIQTKELELVAMKSQLIEQEKHINTTSMKKQKCELELSMKQNEYQKLQNELDLKRSECIKLSSNRNSYLRIQDEFQLCKLSYNESTEQYPNKINDYKKQMKVSLLYSML